MAQSSIHSFIHSFKKVTSTKRKTLHQDHQTPLIKVYYSFFSRTTNPQVHLLSPFPHSFYFVAARTAGPSTCQKKNHKINITNYGNFQHDQKEFVASIFKGSRRPHMTNHLFFFFFEMYIPMSALNLWFFLDWWDGQDLDHIIFGFSLKRKGGKGVITMNFAPHISSSVAGTAVILFFGFS